MSMKKTRLATANASYNHFILPPSLLKSYNVSFFIFTHFVLGIKKKWWPILLQAKRLLMKMPRIMTIRAVHLTGLLKTIYQK